MTRAKEPEDYAPHSFKQGDRVKIRVPESDGDWLHGHDGNTGIVACVYPYGLGIDVDMLDGPSEGWVVNFRPRQLIEE